MLFVQVIWKENKIRYCFVGINITTFNTIVILGIGINFVYSVIP